MFDHPYDFFLEPHFRKLFKPTKPVRHHQTCPVCGRKLVNTYLKDGEWKCLKCREERI